MHLFSLLVFTCLLFASVQSKSIFLLNEKERKVEDTFSFQPRDEIKARDLQKRPNNEGFGDWYEKTNDVLETRRQSCSGLHGSWLC